jgi:chromosome partitioning protein
MRKMAVMNQKGGCGKTTIAINLAAALAALKRQVLLVDLDPQSHATVGLGVRWSNVEHTSYELLMDPLVRTVDAQQEIAESLYLVPSSTVLSGVEQELADRMGREERLANKLAQLGDGSFDFVIIDCPPSVGLLTFNALIAADEVVIPVDASYFSLHGLSKLRETIEVIEEELKRHFTVHVVCNNFDTRTHFSNEMLQETEKFHSAILADTFISHTVRLKEAAAKGVSILDLDHGSKASRQFLALARELMGKETERMKWEPEIVEKAAEAIEREPAMMEGETKVVESEAAATDEEAEVMERETDVMAKEIHTDNLDQWMEKLHGPRKISEGVLFSLDVSQARTVAVTGEFTNWSKEGVPMQKDGSDGLWKVVLDIKPGEYEYRFIVDGVWIRDPGNRDYIRNEFGQENSLLIV